MPMHRRDVLRLMLLMGVSGISLGVAGCGKDESGKPRAIKLGRDVCEHCTMLISDPAYAAQLWDPVRGQQHLFDDIGCATMYAAENGIPDGPETRVWVASSERPGEWLDARAAFFRTDARSPMGYNYAAMGGAGAQRIDFTTMRTQAIERGLCRAPGAERMQRG